MLDAGMPPSSRLRRAADFAALRKPTGRLSSECFRIRYRDNQVGFARLGQAVSRRVSKRAVDRNRIKRIVRESFRLARAQMPHVDVLIIANPAAAAASRADLRADLDRLWQRLQRRAR
ncbi:MULTISPECIES: ribonuclease P protein component [Oleiagrimonas]|uniref:Ribonuclease P protein component n=1 Tax=Oleiagrimonas citrea TaxID=1665687 RepID=A0A846ZR91_9GAMM|nr:MULTISPECIES: ribonuclease P protein component [Oleiagrimonas]NKZ40068.1 ribonuclease P protein component [Oleiagrimonas citrea]RAP57133.1 ribonuclease P protein component [Oleiagrimonas sp. MCCC 1A03011]